MRAIYDLADLDRSLFMQSTGQSGNVMSPWYANLAERWARVEYITIPARREAIEAAHRLLIHP
jgi:penicillin amidase